MAQSSCSRRQSFPLAVNSDQQPRQTPVPLEWTKENQGKRCEATGYFGLRTIETHGDGYSPFCLKLQRRLSKAAGEGNLEEIKKTLKEGANPKQSVDELFLPLLIAASSGQTEAVRLLLDNGVDVNHVADFQNTALSFAASDGHTETVRLLLERGADPCYPEKGATAGDTARRRGFEDTAQLLKKAEAEKCR